MKAILKIKKRESWKKNEKIKKKEKCTVYYCYNP